MARDIDVRQVVRDLLADPVYSLLISPGNRAALTRTGYPGAPPPLAAYPPMPSSFAALPAYSYRFPCAACGEVRDDDIGCACCFGCCLPPGESDASPTSTPARGGPE